MDNPGRAWYFYFNSGNYGMSYGSGRDHGQGVRPVRSASQN